MLYHHVRHRVLFRKNKECFLEMMHLNAVLKNKWVSGAEKREKEGRAFHEEETVCAKARVTKVNGVCLGKCC